MLEKQCCSEGEEEEESTQPRKKEVAQKENVDRISKNR